MNDLGLLYGREDFKGATVLSCALHPVLSKSRVCEDIRITFFLIAYN